MILQLMSYTFTGKILVTVGKYNANDDKINSDSGDSSSEAYQ
jgi:hypothetical protein